MNKVDKRYCSNLLFDDVQLFDVAVPQVPTLAEIFDFRSQLGVQLGYNTIFHSIIFDNSQPKLSRVTRPSQEHLFSRSTIYFSKVCITDFSMMISDEWLCKCYSKRDWTGYQLPSLSQLWLAVQFSWIFNFWSFSIASSLKESLSKGKQTFSRLFKRLKQFSEKIINFLYLFDYWNFCDGRRSFEL